MPESTGAPSSPVSAPRSQWYRRSPQTESHSACMPGRSSASSCCMVRDALGVEADFGARADAGQVAQLKMRDGARQLDGSSPISPSGFCMSLAILAR